MTLFSASLSLLWLAAFWLMTRDRPDGRGLLGISIIASIVAVVIAADNLHSAILSTYPTDSFWTLATSGRLGVIAISTIGLGAMFAGLAWKTRRVLQIKTQVSATAWMLFDMAAGCLIFGIIHTISPQVFYSFYRLIFDGLPNQWVIDTLFDRARMQAIAALPANANMADHLAGVILWAVVPFTGWLHLRHWWRG